MGVVVLCLVVVVVVVTEVFNTGIVRGKDVSSIFRVGSLALVVLVVRDGTFVGVSREESRDEARESSTELGVLNSMRRKERFHPRGSPPTTESNKGKHKQINKLQGYHMDILGVHLLPAQQEQTTRR